MSQFDCPVCFDLYLDPVTIPCGHTFCRSCLTRLANSLAKCAICQAPITQLRSEVNFILKRIIETSFPERLRQRKQRQTLEPAPALQTKQHICKCISIEYSSDRQLPVPMKIIKFAAGQLTSQWFLQNSPNMDLVIILQRRGVYGKVSKIQKGFLHFRGLHLVDIIQRHQLEGQSQHLQCCHFKSIKQAIPNELILQRLDNTAVEWLRQQTNRNQIEGIVLEKVGAFPWAQLHPLAKMWTYVGIVRIPKPKLLQILDQMNNQQKLLYLDRHFRSKQQLFEVEAKKVPWIQRVSAERMFLALIFFLVLYTSDIFKTQQPY